MHGPVVVYNVVGPSIQLPLIWSQDMSLSNSLMLLQLRLRNELKPVLIDSMEKPIWQ